MSDPGYFEVARNQRAHRRLLPDPIPDEDLDRILSTAVCAPSAQNTQPWEFVVVSDADVKESIAAATKAFWQDFARDFTEGNVDDVQFADVDRWAQRGIAEAPVLVVVCLDTSRMPVELAGSSIWPAVQNLLLSAAALGYGSLMATLPTYTGDSLTSVLGLPEQIIPLATVPIGRPARELGAPRRDPFVDHTHRNAWGRPW
jgi:nitroreductase